MNGFCYIFTGTKGNMERNWENSWYDTMPAMLFGVGFLNELSEGFLVDGRDYCVEREYQIDTDQILSNVFARYPYVSTLVLSHVPLRQEDVLR